MADGCMPRRHHLDRRAGDLIPKAAEGDPEETFTTERLAGLLGVSVQWVANGRHCGYGPDFVRLSPRLIRYRRADVVRWLEGRKFGSTVQAKRGGES